MHDVFPDVFPDVFIVDNNKNNYNEIDYNNNNNINN